MKLFDQSILELRELVEKRRSATEVRPLRYHRCPSWPVSEKGDIILKQDAGLELGNPRDESLSLLLWTENKGLIHDDRITLIGPQLKDIPEKAISFGKIVTIDGKGFNGENLYDRYREMSLVRFDLGLSGYMVRGVSHEMREWARISRKALERGFDLSHLGSRLINRFKELDYIEAVEVVFVTSSTEEIRAFRMVGEKAQRNFNAMRKMAEEMSMDCSTCDFEDICRDVEDLRSMRNALKFSDQ